MQLQVADLTLHMSKPRLFQPFLSPIPFSAINISSVASTFIEINKKVHSST